MSTEIKTIEDEEIDILENKPYVLILHNDNHSTFDWVINCLIRICNHNVESATQIAYLVHYKGKSEVRRGELNKLTNMKNRLVDCGLSCTIEKK